MSLLSYFEALEASPIGVFVKDKAATFACIEAVHLMALALLGASVLSADLRLLNVVLREAVAQAAAKRPVAAIERDAHAALLKAGFERIDYVAVRRAEWAGSDFDARFSATWRQYRYQVWNDPTPNPLMADTVWHVATPLAIDAMRRAAAHLIGEHDFSSFCRRPKVADDQVEPSMTRIVLDATWTLAEDAPLLRFEVRGSAFCHQQVRSMVGTLVAVGVGRLAAERIPEILAARDRAAAGQVAPPQGLNLWAVGYEGARWDAEPVPAETMRMDTTDALS